MVKQKFISLNAVLKTKDLSFVSKRGCVSSQYYLQLFNEHGWIIGTTKDYEEKRIDNFIRKNKLHTF